MKIIFVEKVELLYKDMRVLTQIWKLHKITSRNLKNYLMSLI